MSKAEKLIGDKEASGSSGWDSLSEVPFRGTGFQGDGYVNSEHYYNHLGSQQVAVARETTPDPTERSEYPGYGYQGSGYADAESFYNDYGDRPVMVGQGISNDPGYKSSEHYYNEGFIEGAGRPNIDGKEPAELIRSGDLTPETIREGDREVVYEDIMMGTTRDKDMLAKKVDLVMSDDKLVHDMLSNQCDLAIRGKVEDGVDRRFQFLATTKMLIEKGYDVDSLDFGGRDLAKMLAEFRKSYKDKSPMDDPSWFKDGQAPEGYDMRRVNNPWLFAGGLISEMYGRNPGKFQAEYEKYKQETKMPEGQALSYEEFMHYSYGIDV